MSFDGCEQLFGSLRCAGQGLGQLHFETVRRGPESVHQFLGGLSRVYFSQGLGQFFAEGHRLFGVVEPGGNQRERAVWGERCEGSGGGCANLRFRVPRDE